MASLKRVCHVFFVLCLALWYNIELFEALRQFYKSDLYSLVSKGISDMHCMSDEYLVEELKDENRIK